MEVVKNYINSFFYGNGLTCTLRILSGLLFIYSGFFKVLDIENFGRIILMYDVMPEVFAPYAAIIVPFLELVLGILLLAGYKIRAASFVTIILMILFMIFIAINVVRGNTFDCGCFELSHFGIKEEIGIPLLIRDAVVLAVVAVLFYAKKHVLSIESLLEKNRLGDI